MPHLSGFELANHINLLKNGTDLVFITSYKEYALDAFDVHAFDYIVKPISLERLKRTVFRAIEKRKVISNINEENNYKMLVVCFGGMYIKNSEGVLIRSVSAKCSELFGYLLINRGKSITRSMIIEDIFKGMPIKNAETYLNTTIYQLRKSLEPHGMKTAIISNGDTYSIDLKDIYVDFIDFEKSIAGLKMVDENNLEKAREIEKLYCGDFLGDKLFHWSVSESERLSEMYIDFAKKIVDYFLARGNLSSALIIIKKVLAINNLDEEANCLLLRIYAAQRNKNSLVSHYEKYAKNLKKELGVIPENSVINLFAELRKQLG